MGDLETLAFFGTQLDKALFVTRNSGALISSRGGYAPLQTVAHGWAVSAKRVSLRIYTALSTRLFRATPHTAEDRSIPDLVAISPDGTISHKIFAQDFQDQLALDMLDKDTSEHIHFEPEADHKPEDGKEGNVVPLTALRQARNTWDRCGLAQHANDMLYDQGKIRSACLPYIGSSRIWPILPAVFDKFLAFLVQRKVPISFSIPSYALMQSAKGVVQEFWAGRETCHLGFDKTNIAFEKSALESVWIGTNGENTWMEIYDSKGQAILMLSCGDAVTMQSWQRLLFSLPRT